MQYTKVSSTLFTTRAHACRVIETSEILSPISFSWKIIYIYIYSYYNVEPLDRYLLGHPQ